MRYERSGVHPAEHRKNGNEQKRWWSSESLSPDELADAYMELTGRPGLCPNAFPASRITILSGTICLGIVQPHL